MVRLSMHDPNELCMTPTNGFAEEKSYVCAINEVYECVTVTGGSRVC